MKPTAEQLARMSRLLDEVLDRDDAGRRRWLESLPEEHRDLEPALRRALLTEEMRTVEHDLVLPRIAPPDEPTHDPSSGPQPRKLVGPWRLVRPLGSGGMAEVWLAERADGAFAREVALKIPVDLQRREDLAQRFALERDILASLEHPHIARFYDAGVADDGRPYLALEYVPGRNLLQWADEHKLGIRARVELLLQVVYAVQYAHEKGVLHRDIKPNNVLVTEAGRVSLLDFGVARLMERTTDVELTQVFGRALTPEYASPEQLRGETVDAASDVYALGVMLYELLSGRRPYEVSGMMFADRVAPGGPIDPPSARVDQVAADRRGGSVPHIARALRRDLDAIALKALARVPAQRYGSAASLAHDLREWLAGRPVRAVPDTPMYRIRRFVGRHRAGVIGTSLAIVVIVGLAYGLLRETSRGGHVTAAADTPGQAPAAKAAPAAPIPDDKSIAVLPFADLSEKRDQAWLADGLAEELIDRLARSRNLRVIARTSAFAFRDASAPEDARAVGSRLGVAYLLTGSVRRHDDVLRITARLVRAADGSQLWSESYERKVQDVFKVQDEIAATVARALESALVGRPPGTEARRPDIEAYHLMLQADVFSNGPFQRDAERAEQLYRRATQIDPTYALAWAKLGLTHLRKAALGWAPAAASHAEARRTIDMALKVDPQSMAAHAARFQYQVGVEHRWSDARAILARMRAIDPNDALYLPACEAAYAGIAGDLDEAIRVQSRIVDRDPLNSAALGPLSFYLFHRDQLEAALVHFRRELEMNPHAIGNHAYIGVALALLGRQPEALNEMVRERHDGLRLWAFATAHWALGRQADSDAALAELMKRAAGNAYRIATVRAFRGERDAALEWLDKACSARDGGCEFIRSDRFLHDLREDRRFRAVLARMKLDAGAAAAR